MATPRFLQVHTLHSYPAALLNRDNSGLAKRMEFGGSTRTRISSQCLKWHWRGKTRRTEDGMQYEDRDFALHKIDGVKMADRTRNAVENKIIQPLRDADGIDKAVIDAVADAFNVGVYGDRGTSRDARQPLLLGLPEVEYFRDKAAAICAQNPNDAKAASDDAKEFFNNNRNNFRAMREQLKVDLPVGQHAGIEGALFGRMVTSDTASNIEAAIHVAHAFTVHEQESGNDYFTAVDDLQRKGDDAGASFIGDAELTAGLFYGYVVIDVPGLVSNLEGCKAEEWNGADRELAGKVVEHLTHLIATVSPGAKLGSTAPYACADLILVEAGSRQPRSLANAYRKPARAQVEAATDGLAGYLGKLDKAYGGKETRRVMSVEDCDIPGAERLCLDDLATWAADVVRNGQAV